MRRAFTLSELLLAAVIAASVFSAMLLLFMNRLILNEANRNLTQGTSHAQYVMEEIKDYMVDRQLTSSVITYIDTNWDLADPAAVSAQGLRPLESESIAVQATGTDLLDVEVSVNWQDKRGRAYTVSLETLIAEP
jgi:competence protein ComGC